MARQEIILGALPNGLGGDPPRTASEKINYMTQELYDKNAALGNAASGTTVDSSFDLTAGRILKTGYCGLGLAVTPTWDDMNSVLVNGVFRATATLLNRPPGTSGNGDSYQHFNWNGIATDGAAVQVYYSYSMNKSFIRAKRSGVWTAWEAQLRTADIVGSVAIGSILERGSNSNGDYTKFLDGTLMTWGKQTASTVCLAGQGLSWNPNNLTLQPATFVGAWQSVIKYSMYDSAGTSLHVAEFSYGTAEGGLILAGMNTGNSPSASHPSFTLGPRTAVTYTAHFFSIGRWK